MISSKLNSNQRRTLDAVFRQPVPQGVRWSDVESLVAALGGSLSERKGSRVALSLNGKRAVFHRPHPSPLTDRNALRNMREFLERAGIKP
ncbi:MAG: type II toxin-antitoxin system HicA family toxin [Gemmatimonadaceae bacterium]